MNVQPIDKPCDCAIINSKHKTEESAMQKQRSPYAKALADPLFRKRIVAARKGKGSYTRKQKGNKCQD